ncbi:MAG: hypothetical protein QGI49_01960, partial [SAR202 cluster bacterium]|nr:hypothetical protein [SAR202 cluster bacterium]
CKRTQIMQRLLMGSPSGRAEDLVSDARGHCEDNLHEARRAVTIVSRAGRRGGTCLKQRMARRWDL